MSLAFPALTCCSRYCLTFCCVSIDVVFSSDTTADRCISSTFCADKFALIACFFASLATFSVSVFSLNFIKKVTVSAFPKLSSKRSLTLSFEITLELFTDSWSFLFGSAFATPGVTRENTMSNDAIMLNTLIRLRFFKFIPPSDFYND